MAVALGRRPRSLGSTELLVNGLLGCAVVATWLCAVVAGKLQPGDRGARFSAGCSCRRSRFWPLAWWSAVLVAECRRCSHAADLATLQLQLADAPRAIGHVIEAIVSR